MGIYVSITDGIAYALKKPMVFLNGSNDVGNFGYLQRIYFHEHQRKNNKKHQLCVAHVSV